MDIRSSFLTQIRFPGLGDKELIFINLTSGYMSIDSECQLFMYLPSYSSSTMELSVYNRRKRILFPFNKRIRLRILDEFNRFEDVNVVDNIPLEVCKLSRISRAKVCREQVHSSQNKDYCASQGTNYYGYKLHAVFSANGVFKSLDISPASVFDVNYPKDIKDQLADYTLFGNRGYFSAVWQLYLFTDCNIRLDTPIRDNQADYREQPYIFKKTRKRIGTLFSQLCDQFMIFRNYAKTFEGFKTRILSKITALTMVQDINRFILCGNINHIKLNIA